MIFSSYQSHDLNRVMVLVLCSNVSSHTVKICWQTVAGGYRSPVGNMLHLLAQSRKVSPRVIQQFGSGHLSSQFSNYFLHLGVQKVLHQLLLTLFQLGVISIIHLLFVLSFNEDPWRPCFIIRHILQVFLSFLRGY